MERGSVDVFHVNGGWAGLGLAEELSSTFVHAVQVTDDNYLVTSVLMASWGFDQDCPMAGSTGCELKAILSVYPRDVDARVPRPPGKAAMYTAYTYGLVTGETDYTGRMFYSLADNMVIDKNTGELTIQTHKEGYHQVVVIMSYPGNVAPVPVDFIIRVLPASCVQEPDSDKHWCTLCTPSVMQMLPGYTCAFAAPVMNSFVPELSVLASTLKDITGQLERGNNYAGGIVPRIDVRNDLYPQFLRMFAGFELNLALVAQDTDLTGAAGGTYEQVFTKVGFNLGRMPASAKFSTVEGVNPSRMEMVWTPCESDVGWHTMCFSATDSHQQPGQGPGRPFAESASSEQRCVQVKVEREPAPHFMFGEGLTPLEPQMCTMGRETKLNLVVVSPNCQVDMQMRAQEKWGLPEGAKVDKVGVRTLGSPPVGEEEVALPTGCREATFVLEWTPLYTQVYVHACLVFSVLYQRTHVLFSRCCDLSILPSHTCPHAQPGCAHKYTRFAHTSTQARLCMPALAIRARVLTLS
jgi:hypothetical protein